MSLTTDIDFRALGAAHARRGMRLSGPAFAVADQIEYERGWQSAQVDFLAEMPQFDDAAGEENR